MDAEERGPGLVPVLNAAWIVSHSFVLFAPFVVLSIANFTTKSPKGYERWMPRSGRRQIDPVLKAAWIAVRCPPAGRPEGELKLVLGIDLHQAQRAVTGQPRAKGAEGDRRPGIERPRRKR